VTGKASPGPGYAVATVAHCETVCRSFYDYHLEAGAGPLANPFPLARKNGRANAHHNPMEPFRQERAGLFRPRQPKRVPRGIPDRMFDELFASLPSNRDRALAAFWVSTGARASELLGVTRGSVDPGSQLVTVIRKGSRAMQPLPASPDAFVWLRLYQEETHGLVPSGPDDPLWWTLRRPFRPLAYHAARAMFTRAGASLGANWSLHDIRHCAAYRMARDPQMPMCSGSWATCTCPRLRFTSCPRRRTSSRAWPGTTAARPGTRSRRRRRSRRGTGPSRWTCCSGGKGDRPRNGDLAGRDAAAPPDEARSRIRPDICHRGRALSG